MRACPTVSGVTPTPTAAHAEVDRVDVESDAIRIRGALIGVADPQSADQLIARRRSDGVEMRVPATVAETTFEVAIPFSALPWEDDSEPEFWDLWIADLRIGRHLDDVQNKRGAHVF